MTKSGEHNVFLQLLQMIGKDWEENGRPEEIRLSPDKIDALIGVNNLVTDPNEALTAKEIRAAAPSFAAIYRQVMLREIEEKRNDGSAHP